MLKKLRKMKYGTTVLACATPAFYMVILVLCDAFMPEGISHLTRLGAGAGTALFAYTYHMGARELPERRNILIAAVHLFLFAAVYTALMLLKNTVPLIAVPYSAFVGHSSITGAWMFMFAMEIARSIRRM